MEIITCGISSNDQPASFLTKSLRGPRIDYICRITRFLKQLEENIEDQIVNGIELNYSHTFLGSVNANKK